MYQVAAFYRFISISDIESLKKSIVTFGESVEGLCGTILLAPEGVNATIAALNLESMIDFLDETLGIRQGELKFSTSEEKPFNRFKVRPKKEIITLRMPQADPNKVCGTYVDADDWNDLINDPEVVLIDTRNHYETKVGIFRNALDPQLDVFSEFPEWVEKNLDPQKNKKVAMFCTGGIRCEKASSYMKQVGFEEVYHLKGGILKYLETIPAEQSLWDGECFVFDKRVSVTHGLEEGNAEVCYTCQSTLTAEEVKSPHYEKGISCQYCIEGLTPGKARSLRQRHEHYKSVADHQSA
jgi:UPF0176 protein